MNKRIPIVLIILASFFALAFFLSTGPPNRRGSQLSHRVTPADPSDSGTSSEVRLEGDGSGGSAPSLETLRAVLRSALQLRPPEPGPDRRIWARDVIPRIRLQLERLGRKAPVIVWNLLTEPDFDDHTKSLLAISGLGLPFMRQLLSDRIDRLGTPLLQASAVAVVTCGLSRGTLDDRDIYFLAGTHTWLSRLILDPPNETESGELSQRLLWASFELSALTSVDKPDDRQALVRFARRALMLGGPVRIWTLERIRDLRLADDLLCQDILQIVDSNPQDRILTRWSFEALGPCAPARVRKEVEKRLWSAASLEYAQCALGALREQEALTEGFLENLLNTGAAIHRKALIDLIGVEDPLVEEFCRRIVCEDPDPGVRGYAVEHAIVKTFNAKWAEHAAADRDPTVRARAVVGLARLLSDGFAWSANLESRVLHAQKTLRAFAERDPDSSVRSLATLALKNPSSVARQ